MQKYTFDISRIKKKRKTNILTIDVTSQAQHHTSSEVEHNTVDELSTTVLASLHLVKSWLSPWPRSILDLAKVTNKQASLRHLPHNICPARRKWRHQAADQAVSVSWSLSRTGTSASRQVRRAWPARRRRPRSPLQRPTSGQARRASRWIASLRTLRQSDRQPSRRRRLSLQCR